MKQRISRTRILAGGLATLIFFGLVGLSSAQEATTNAPANDAAPSGSGQQARQSKGTGAETVAKTAGPQIKQLTGAELYSMHCARCHPERYPNERTSAQWKTIALHMRVRANLPAEHIRKLLKYLQENSGY